MTEETKEAKEVKEAKPKSVYDIKITRGKDGVLKCAFYSPALAKIASALADGKKTTITVAGRNIDVFDCESDLLTLAQEASLTSTPELLEYTNGEVNAINLAPLCAVALGAEGGLVLEPTFPHSAVALDAYAKSLRGFVRAVLAAVAPVEISVRLVTKK